MKTLDKIPARPLSPEELDEMVDFFEDDDFSHNYPEETEKEEEQVG